MIYRFLADLVVAAHVLYVSVVVFGFLAILAGGPLRWNWVRNRWFRVVHLLMIAFVASEVVIGFRCPLDIVEEQFRHWGGQGFDDSFMVRVLNPLFRFNFPRAVFDVLYVGFALVVLGTFWITPVRWRPTRGGPAGGRLPQHG